MFPLYYKMRVRVNEKITKGKHMTILKHTSCVVVGWRLDPADERGDNHAERLLHHLPRCILLYFPGATWQVHPDLPVGVYPLKPVTRQWILNEESGAKVDRKGFFIVPDYASTGFMIQGTSLDHGLAECGDILSTPGLSETLTTYVILSRLRRAHGLLLLRAFSPFLFRMGCPPGPQCLLKLLRQKFGKAPADATGEYNHEAAEQEYKVLAVKWEQHKKLLKMQGLQWRCFNCRRNLPTNAFGANVQTCKEVHKRCVAPGYWRRCNACASIKYDASPVQEIAEDTKECLQCQQLRRGEYFRGESSICNSCAESNEARVSLCDDCGKMFKNSVGTLVTEDGLPKFCNDCRKNHEFLKCTICKEEREIGCFSEYHQREDPLIHAR